MLHRKPKTWLLLSIKEGVFFWSLSSTPLPPLIVLVVINNASCASCKARQKSAWHLDTIGASVVWLFIFRNTTHDLAVSCRRAAALVYAQPRFP